MEWPRVGDAARDGGRTERPIDRFNRYKSGQGNTFKLSDFIRNTHSFFDSIVLAREDEHEFRSFVNFMIQKLRVFTTISSKSEVVHRNIRAGKPAPGKDNINISSRTVGPLDKYLDDDEYY